MYVFFGKFETAERHMGHQVQLKKGRVYRTKDFARWASNPSRLVKCLVKEGRLVRLGYGLYAHPEPSRFGPTPPTDQEVVRSFLEGAPMSSRGLRSGMPWA